jgi:hypothetical protein
MSDTNDSTNEKIVRVEYVKAAPADIVNADGRLTAVPEDFDNKLHLSPKKGDFASEDLYSEFKASEYERRGNEMLETAKKLREQAAEIRTFGDPATRAKVKKLQRLRDAQAELEAALLAEGIEL